MKLHLFPHTFNRYFGYNTLQYYFCWAEKYRNFPYSGDLLFYFACNGRMTLPQKTVRRMNMSRLGYFLAGALTGVAGLAVAAYFTDRNETTSFEKEDCEGDDVTTCDMQEDDSGVVAEPQPAS